MTTHFKDWSIKTKLFTVVGLVFFMALIIGAVLQYHASRNEVIDRILNEARSVRGVLMATRRVYHHQFIDSGIPLNDKTLGFLPAHALKRISDDFKNWVDTGLSFNNVSDRPRNSDNRADAIEMESIQFFRANKEEKERLVSFKNTQGEEFFHYSQPIWIEQYCLKCHGSREDAPPTIRKLYANAYDYKLGDLRGILSIKLPVDVVNKAAMQRHLTGFAFLVGLFVFIYFIIQYLIRHLVTDRMSRLSDIAQQIALGKDGVVFHEDSMDEIGQVERSINKMVNQIRQREQDLAITLNSIGDAVIATDAQGNITRMNPVAEQLTGWLFEEARGKSVKSVFPIIDASTRELIENPVEKVISTGETVYLSNHTTLISRDGTEYQIADSAAPIRNGDNNILGMVLIFNDVTEQYQLRETVAKSKYNLQAIMDNSPAIVYVKDMDGCFTFINWQFEQLFHIKREDITGKNLHDIFPKDIADKMQANDNAVLDAKYTLEFEEEIPHKDGSRTYASIKFPLFNADGNIYAVCCMSTDITERKHTGEIMHNIATGVSAQIGEAFFQSLAVHLAEIFDVEYIVIGLLDEHKENSITTVALCIHGEITDNLSYDLEGTPCCHVIEGDSDRIRSYPSNIQQLFPDDLMLVEMEAQSYIGAPLIDSSGKHIGLIVVIDNKPMENIKQVESILRIFAIRATAELERLKGEEALQVNTQRLADAQRMAHIGSWELDLVKNRLEWSDEIYRIFDIDPEKFEASYEAFLNAIHPDDREKVNVAYAESVKNKTPYVIDHRLRMPDGTIKYVHERCKTFYDDAGNPVRSSGIIQDITEQTSLEASLRRTQKMDALGKLTGGIAHDYNNMLGVVMGYAGLLEDALSEQPELAKYAHEIHHAGERGAKLTKKLLAFTRQKTSEADCLNLNALLQNEQHMLEKTLTARIKLVFKLEENLWPVWLDDSDMEDAILNMSINAMHAIEGSGQLIIQTRNQKVNQIEAQSLAILPGDYVLFSITDTGCGMNEATKEKIFEPFFSTKGKKGTGLGLSQVYGFVKRSKGAIKVYSEPDHGTLFTLYFPRYYKASRKEQLLEESKAADIIGSETILVVDDEPALLSLSCEILRQHGFNVIAAENAKKALGILEQNKSIELLISDIIMPEMDGYQLSAIVKEKYPTIKIQLASGFADNSNMDMVDESLQKNLLLKPFNSRALLQRVRDLLNA